MGRTSTGFDSVNYNNGAYAVGEVTGMIAQEALFTAIEIGATVLSGGTLGPAALAFHAARTAFTVGIKTAARVAISTVAKSAAKIVASGVITSIATTAAKTVVKSAARSAAQAGGGAAIFGTVGFVAGGLTGEGEWDWSKATAGAFSGAMVGASFGLMMGGKGGVVSGTLLSAGMGGFGSMEVGKTANWGAWAGGTVIGDASGLVSGLSSSRIAKGLDRRYSQTVVGLVSQVAGAARGNIAAQNLQVVMGLREQQSLFELGFSMAGAGVGAGISAGLSRGLFHTKGVFDGALKCSVSETNFVARQVIGGILGGAIGNVADQTAGYLTDGKAIDWGSLAMSAALGGATSLAGSRTQFKGMMKACFTGDHKARARDLFGPRWKRLDEILRGDDVWARDESDVNSSCAWKEVEEVFEFENQILHVHAQGRVLRTTAEHRIFAYGKGWIAAKNLQPGDLLSSDDGQRVRVEEVYETGETHKTYTLRVADWHTYFIGDDDWGFSVWVHNACTVEEVRAKTGIAEDGKARHVAGLINKGELGKAARYLTDQGVAKSSIKDMVLPYKPGSPLATPPISSSAKPGLIGPVTPYDVAKKGKIPGYDEHHLDPPLGRTDPNYDTGPTIRMRNDNAGGRVAGGINLHTAEGGFQTALRDHITKDLGYNIKQWNSLPDHARRLHLRRYHASFGFEFPM